MKKQVKLSFKLTKSKKNENEMDNHKDFLDDKLELLKDNDENSENFKRVNILPDLETDMPSRAWRRMSERQTFKTVTPLNIHSPVKPDCLRFVCLSDTHSKLHVDDMLNFYIPPGDILLHAGDFTMKGRPLEIERFNEALGHGDLTKAGINVGCVELLNTVQKRVKPNYHLFGHIHEGYGVTTDGETLFINASSCTKGYKLSNPPIIFDVPLPPGQSKDRLLESVEVVSYSKEESSSKTVIDISKKDIDNKLLTFQQLKLTKTKAE